MKLNKITMDYIRKLVNEKAKAKKDKLFATLVTLEKERRNFIDKFDKDIDKLRKETAKKAEAIGKKYEMPHETSWGSNIPHEIIVLVNNFDRDKHPFNKKKIADASEAVKKFDELVENTTNELIAKLSLGGDLADLERMLGEIKF